MTIGKRHPHFNGPLYYFHLIKVYRNRYSKEVGAGGPPALIQVESRMICLLSMLHPEVKGLNINVNDRYKGHNILIKHLKCHSFNEIFD